MTASRVLGIPADQITVADRSRAKAVNFGVIYGMSGFGLSEELNITRKEAEDYIKEYFKDAKLIELDGLPDENSHEYVDLLNKIHDQIERGE